MKDFLNKIQSAFDTHSKGFSARLNTPTWGTPPTNIRMGITFLFVRRS